MSFFRRRIANNYNWGLYWVYIKSKAQDKYKNQGLVGQNTHGSRGDKFLEIEPNRKIGLPEISFCECRSARNYNWAMNWLFVKSTTQEDYKN